MTMHVKPFAFDRVFAVTPPGATKDADALRLEVEHLELELLRVKRDMEAQVALARAEAFQAAVEQVRAEREQALLAATDALQAQLETLDARFHELELQVARHGGEVALAAADHLAARALELAPGAAIDAAIGRALRQVRRGQPITVRVHPDFLDDIEALVADRQTRDRRRLGLTVVADAALAPGDARLEWENGGLALDADARREAVARELDELFPVSG
jgi:flagellar assembly protein FliH